MCHGSFILHNSDLANVCLSRKRAWLKTYIFKPVLAELNHQMQKYQSSKPEAPHDHFFHCLDIQHTKNENELVENEIPKLVFEVLKRKIFIKVITIIPNPFKEKVT